MKMKRRFEGRKTESERGGSFDGNKDLVLWLMFLWVKGSICHFGAYLFVKRMMNGFFCWGKTFLKKL